MNTEPSENKQKLLGEVLGGDSFAAFDEGLKQRALGEFRHARFVRRVRGISAMAAIIVAAGSSLLWFPYRKSPVEMVSRHVPVSNEAASVPDQAGEAEPGMPRAITEEQLLAYFPKDSCFVAEVEGRKVLVFRDPEVRKQYLY